MSQVMEVPTHVIPTHTLYIAFSDIAQAEKAVGALMDSGVRADDISLVYKKDHHEHHQSSDVVTPAYGSASLEPGIPINPSYDAGEHTSRTHIEEDSEHNAHNLQAKTGISTTTPGDAASGAAKGAGVGLGVGVAAALASIFLPGFGLVLGGGALALAIAGAAGTTAAGAIAGGVTGYLRDQGVSDDSARKYNETYESGGAILSVNTPSHNVSRAQIENVLAKYNASYVDAFDYRASGNRYSSDSLIP